MDKAVGGGLLYNATWSLAEEFVDLSYPGYTYTELYEWTMSRNGFGAFAFFGVGRFFELNLGFLYKNPSKLKLVYTEKETGYYDYVYEGEEDASFIPGTAALQVGLYVKVPFVVSDKMVVFPTAGIDYELSFDEEWFDDIWIRAGGGMDFFFSDRMFLRTHLIYGIAIPTGGTLKEVLDFTIGHGFLLKAGIGWMF